VVGDPAHPDGVFVLGLLQVEDEQPQQLARLGDIERRFG